MRKPKRVAELHDGALSVEETSVGRRYTLALPPA